MELDEAKATDRLALKNDTDSKLLFRILFFFSARLPVAPSRRIYTFIIYFFYFFTFACDRSGVHQRSKYETLLVSRAVAQNLDCEFFGSEDA